MWLTGTKGNETYCTAAQVSKNIHMCVKTKCKLSHGHHNSNTYFEISECGWEMHWLVILYLFLSSNNSLAIQRQMKVKYVMLISKIYIPRIINKNKEINIRS